MWRSLRRVSKLSFPSKTIQKRYSNDTSSGNKSKIFGIIASTGLGFAGVILYGNYDPNFRNTLEKYIPYISSLYSLISTEKESSNISSKQSDEKKESISLLKKKLEREREKDSRKIADSSKSKEVSQEGRDYKMLDSNRLSDLIKELETKAGEATNAYITAVDAAKKRAKTLYEALELPEGSNDDILWKEANQANVDKENAFRIAQQKTATTKEIVEKLRLRLKRDAATDPVVKSSEETIQKVLQQLEKAEGQLILADSEAKTAADYQKLVNNSKEKFKNELSIVLPNYIHGVKDQTMTESDLNLLIAHAHRRIEQLQKQLAKQQVTEKMRVDEAVRLQKMKDESMAKSIVEAELEQSNTDLEAAVSDKVSSMKENFEKELRKELHRQAAAHADHIQECLKVQEQELERKYSLDLEEQLLHQKGVFISELSGNIARLKGILAFLKSKSEFDIASKKAQSLWLACQSLNQKITESTDGHRNPLGKYITAIKLAAGEDDDFVNSVLAAIPMEAVSSGVYTIEHLKHRFSCVKKVCQRVAMIDENNDSLFRYFLSYLQSILIIDASSIPKAELEGKVAVDIDEWDTHDVLTRVSYSLDHNDLEQAVKYLNVLKGEPKYVANDFVKELRFLLETQLAVKALLAHAASVSVQAYI